MSESNQRRDREGAGAEFHQSRESLPRAQSRGEGAGASRMSNQLEKDIAGWVEKILQGDAQAISRAITAVENMDAGARELLTKLFPHTGRATIIGVTGATGSGKSTLVDGLTALLRKRGRTVGVLAVDPTSPFTGGAILGYRIQIGRAS